MGEAGKNENKWEVDNEKKQDETKNSGKKQIANNSTHKNGKI